MIKSVVLLVVFMLNFLISGAQQVNETTGAHSCHLRKSMAESPRAIPDNSVYSVPHSFDVLKYTLNLNLYHCYFTPYPKNYVASALIKFKVESTLSMIKLNAVNSSLVIDSVKAAGISFIHANDTLAITMNRSYLPGEIAEVKVYYRHLDVQDGAFFSTGGMLFTDCEPEGARKWFPCWDKPSDKALLDLTAKVPSIVKFASNGKLMDSTFSGDTLIYHWASIHNIATYLMVMTSKVNYNLDIVYWHKLSNPNDSVPILSLIHI